MGYAKGLVDVVKFFRQFNVTKYVVTFFILSLLQFVVGGGVIYYSRIQQEEDAMESLLNRVQRDIKFSNGAWDLTEYNANPFIPDRFRLYVFSVDGYVVDRWRPITGFMDLADMKYLLNFQTIQTIRSIAGQDWRVYSEPIKNDGDNIIGVITVAYHDTNTALSNQIDERLQETVKTIKSNLIIENNEINTSNIKRRSIPYDISFQVVDQYNHILTHNSNTNSMNRIPGFIDPSYVRGEMQNSHARQIRDAGQEAYLVRARTLADSGREMGVVIVGSSIDSVYQTLEQYGLIVGVLSLLLTVIFGGLSYTFTQKTVQTVKKKEVAEPKLLSLDEIISISFDKKNCFLKINENTIPITYATNQYYMVLALFGSPKKKWETDELVDKLGEELDKNSWRKVYDAMATINTKVGSLIDIKLIIVSNKTYQINPQLLNKLA